MECHESLMARRRKRKAGGSSGKKPAGPNVKLDKSLPSLPPHLMEEAQVADESPSEYTGTPDPNQMADTPDLEDRPESSRSNQVDTGTRSPILPHLNGMQVMRSIVHCVGCIVGHVLGSHPIDGTDRLVYSVSPHIPCRIQHSPRF